ncbi:heterokaryon incompatibility protein 6,OR allele [Cladorrhinum sp. PSN332]|nr:heterokaryon incompatibility protein 6,OR allele [Cladorrhinum sp. PSN332]
MSESPPLPPRPGYQYSKLPPRTVRVLNVFSGSGDDVLTCTLGSFHLDHLPAYEALSYCWGDQHEKHEIIVSGCNFQTSTNLHSALLRLRLPDRSRLLWVDAICINQNDIQERNEQVSLMRSIYQRAGCVLIWLGGPIMVNDEETWPIPALVEAEEKKLKRNDLPIRHGTRGWIEFVVKGEWVFGAGDLEDRRWNAIIKALILLLQRPWFLRTWIIQEAALAKHATVVCGSHCVDWETFCRAVNYAIDLDYFAMTSPEIYSALRNIDRAKKRIESGQFPKPLDLLAGFRIFEATDPRDKFFGILGLLDPLDLEGIGLKQANYDMDLVDVYIQVAIDCITLEGNLDVLSVAGESCLRDDNNNNNNALPSWVPDWTVHQEGLKPIHPRFLSTLSFGNYQQISPQSASCDTPLTFSISSDKRVLTLSGYVWDKVTKVSNVLSRDYYEPDEYHPLYQARSPEIQELFIEPEAEKAVAVFQEWELMCGIPPDSDSDSDSHTSVPYPFTSQDPHQVFFQTVHANCFPGGNPSDTRNRFNIYYEPFRRLPPLIKLLEERPEKKNGAKLAARLKWVKKASPDFVRFMGSYAKFLWPKNVQYRPTMVGLHRVMVKTAKGYVGLTAKGVREGDSVVLFKGGRMPVVVREVEGEEGEEKRWRLVGDAYVHGIMGGEVWDKRRCGEMRIA